MRLSMTGACKYASMSGESPQQKQLPRLHARSRREPVEVHTRRQFESGIGHAIPPHGVRSRSDIEESRSLKILTTVISANAEEGSTH